MIKIDKIEIKGKDNIFIKIFLNNKNNIILPKKYTDKLKKATLLELQKYSISASGLGIYWPLIDEDITIVPFLEKIVNK